MMPLINDQSDRPGCLPSLKDEPFLPSIKSLTTSKNDKGHGNNTNFNKENRSKDIHSNYTGTNHQDTYNVTLKPYSSAPASESSTPFKLPTIDRAESNSVTSLFSDRHNGHKGKGRSRDRRTRLCRSPSCPSLAPYWGEHPESPRSTRLNDSTEYPDTRPFLTHRDEDGIKLPSIYNSRKTANSSFTLTSSTANSSTQTSRDSSPFNFKREANFMNLLQQEQSADKPPTHPVSPQHTYVEGDTTMSRSSTQSSALLLPISSCHDSQINGKSKRKRKKHAGLLVASEEGSEAEKLLREKLGAIERRDFERPSPTHHRESENTDLSDTAFIDKVKDETNLANGASEPLTSKPPIYQNTPARIKTEKKVAPVKA